MYNQLMYPELIKRLAEAPLINQFTFVYSARLKFHHYQVIPYL